MNVSYWTFDPRTPHSSAVGLQVLHEQLFDELRASVQASSADHDEPEDARVRMISATAKIAHAERLYVLGIVSPNSGESEERPSAMTLKTT